MSFEITRGAIETAAVEREVRASGYGAVVTFTGVVRARADDDRPVRGLSYEAHEAMAVAEFGRIAQEARERYGDVCVAIVHRVGELDADEIAVVVSVAAEHRAEAFAACSYTIDELKRCAPIWKKERYADGTPDRWRESEAP